MLLFLSLKAEIIIIIKAKTAIMPSMIYALSKRDS